MLEYDRIIPRLLQYLYSTKYIIQNENKNSLHCFLPPFYYRNLCSTFKCQSFYELQLVSRPHRLVTFMIKSIVWTAKEENAWCSFTKDCGCNDIDLHVHTDGRSGFCKDPPSIVFRWKHKCISSKLNTFAARIALCLSPTTGLTIYEPALIYETYPLMKADFGWSLING